MPPADASIGHDLNLRGGGRPALSQDIFGNWAFGTSSRRDACAVTSRPIRNARSVGPVSFAVRGAASAVSTHLGRGRLVKPVGWRTCQEEAKTLGVKLLYQGTTTWSPTLQVPLVQSLLAQDPAALIITPTDGSTLAPVVKQYTAKNIPVIALTPR